LETFENNVAYEHKIWIDLTVSTTLKKPSKKHTRFILIRFGLIDLQSKNNATLGNVAYVCSTSWQ